MGRRADEGEEETLPLAVDEALGAVGSSFRRLGYPNEGLAALGELALAEYRVARRGLDRRGWHGQLMAVARLCGAPESEEIREVGASEVEADFGPG